MLTLISADGVLCNSCSFLIVSLSKSLSLCFMCSDQHVKYRMPRGFPLTSSLLLDYHVKQYTHAYLFALCYCLNLMQLNLSQPWSFYSKACYFLFLDILYFRPLLFKSSLKHLQIDVDYFKHQSNLVHTLRTTSEIAYHFHSTCLHNRK